MKGFLNMGALLAAMWVFALIGIVAFGGTIATTYYMRTPKNICLIIFGIAILIGSFFIIKNFIATEGWFIF